MRNHKANYSTSELDSGRGQTTVRCSCGWNDTYNLWSTEKSHTSAQDGWRTHVALARGADPVTRFI